MEKEGEFCNYLFSLESAYSIIDLVISGRNLVFFIDGIILQQLKYKFSNYN